MNSSIVIVNWNTRDLLEHCLGSIFDNPPEGLFEVFVVDNASSDGSPSIVRDRYPQVHLIENRENVGFARANNQAIRLASGRWIMLLNPDTEIKPDAFNVLVRFLEEHPKAGAVAPRIFNPDGSLQFSCSPAPSLMREAQRLLHWPGIRPDGYYAMQLWDSSMPHPVDVMLGACILFRMQSLVEVGLMDEDYFMYTEEVDLCTRLKKANWELFWVPEAQIIHYGGQSTQQIAQEMFLRLYESKLTYFRKHRGGLATFLYKLLLVIAAMTRIISAPLAMLQKPDRRQSQLKLVDNYKRLLTSLPNM